MSESIRLAFELLILTATRTGEALGATWAEVDLDAKVWTIPGTRMKTGREHRVPLSGRAVEVLERAQGYAAGSVYVFPGRTLAKPLGNSAFLLLLRRLQYDAITTHGFRSSFRDWRRSGRPCRGPSAKPRSRTRSGTRPKPRITAPTCSTGGAS